MVRYVLRIAADAIVVAIALFVSSGTLAWWRAWVLLMVLFTIRAVGAIALNRINPALLRERAGLPIHKEQSWSDRVLLTGVLITGFVGLPLIAGLDVFRWQTFPRPPVWLSSIGLLLFALGWTLKGLALRANAFAIAVVRKQREREHAVADTGPYRVVRHPFYAADPLILVGLGLWLESYVAALASVVPIALMVVRLVLEERFLCRELPGYAAYVERVRSRLLPGIW